MRTTLRGAIAALAAITALAVVSASPAAGGTILVDGSDGTADTAGCGSAANPCNTIQAGIDSASAGDTVLVAAGTYAGAVVNSGVHVVTNDGAVIDSGPFSHPSRFRAGFLFDPDRSGSGASIEGFRFVGAIQSGATDDGRLDFGVFSRGADDVTVSHNTFTSFLQGITDWNGAGWTIDHNTVTDLWTTCGGGIGILAGGFDGLTTIERTTIAHNDVEGTLQVSPTDCGGYDGDGIVLYADFRFGRAGAPSVSGNVVEHNEVDLVSDTPSLVNVIGIEVTAAFDTPPTPAPAVMTGNSIAKNLVDVSGTGILASPGAAADTFDGNHLEGGVTDAVDQSTGTGTAGTANAWTGNKCDSSTPAGLCS